MVLHVANYQPTYFPTFLQQIASGHSVSSIRKHLHSSIVSSIVFPVHFNVIKAVFVERKHRRHDPHKIACKTSMWVQRELEADQEMHTASKAVAKPVSL